MTSSHKPVKVKATLRNLTIAIMKMAGQSQHCRRLPPRVNACAASLARAGAASDADEARQLIARLEQRSR